MYRYPVPSYGLSSAAEADVRAGEAAAALLLGASTQETIVSHSTTAGLGILAAGIGPTLTEGDEIVVTNLDHAANIGCCWSTCMKRSLDRSGPAIRIT